MVYLFPTIPHRLEIESGGELMDRLQKLQWRQSFLFLHAPTVGIATPKKVTKTEKT
jgi:hypothetical protein